MYFSLEQCGCLEPGVIPESNCTDRIPALVTWFPFDEDYHDHTCLGAIGLNYNTEITGDNCAVGDGCVQFFGNGRVEIPFYRNWFERELSGFSLCLWYKRSAVSSFEQEGILQNGDCYIEPTVSFIIYPYENLLNGTIGEDHTSMQVGLITQFSFFSKMR